MNSQIQELTELFKRFPGIGERQAKRFVYFLLAQEPGYVDALTKSIQKTRSSFTQCSLCHRYFEKNETRLCSICTNPKTDTQTLLVVEKDADLEAIDRSKTYKGRYFILGNMIPIADETTIQKTRLPELLKRVTSDIKKENLKEVILAFSLNPHGEHTDRYIRQALQKNTEETPIIITSLGRGLSTGSELEYSDRETLTNALESRR